MGEELVAYLENFGDKTFIIKHKDTIQVINGSFDETASEYIITSFAPYMKNFYYISDHDIIPIKNEEGQRKLIIKKCYC